LLGWYGEPWVIERLHQHSDIELNLVSGGELHYLMGGSRLVIRSGEVAAYWAVTPHRIIHCEPDSRLGVLHIPLTEFLRWELPASMRTSLLHGAPQTRRSQDADFDRALFQRWSADLQRSSVPAAIPDPIRQHRAVMLEAEAFLHRFLKLEGAPDAPATLDDARRSQAERLAQVIAERHTEPVSAEALARDLDLHPNYAMTLFKQAFGLTVRAFLLQHRVAHAQRLLITSELSVLDVAFESGFQSLSRFYAVFSSASGMSPLAYRQRYGR
jgi:AraC-like DNA-binding protein